MRQLVMLFFISFLFPWRVIGQEITEASGTSAIAFDKVYLHTDRPHYFLKDTIWIKAYAWSAVAGEGLRPSTSQTLYLALKNQQTGESLVQTAVLLDEGMGSAQIALADVPVGDYVLLAQSESMRAWESDYTFQRPIRVSEVGAVSLVRGSTASKQTIPLPYQNGLRIGLTSSEGNYQLIIDRTKEQAESVFQLIGLQHGKPMYEQILSLQEGKNVHSLDSEMFLPGLADFALVNEQGDIVAERPVYFHPQAIPTLKISTDRENYRPRERVQVLLHILDEFGEGLEADFSVTVVDSKQVSWPDDMSTIVTEMELGSTLNVPYIFSPHVFEKDLDNATKEINNLIASSQSLTALSRYTAQEGGTFVEYSGIKLSGVVKEKDGKFFEKGTNLDFLIFPNQGSPIMASSMVGDDGRFLVEDVMFQGNAAVLTSRSGKEGKKNFSEFLEATQVTFEPISLPAPNLLTHYKAVKEVNSLDDIRRYSVIRNSRMEERVIDLDTLTIERQSMTFGFTDRTSLYLNQPDIRLEIPEKGFENLNFFQYIRGRVPGLNMVGDVNDIGNPPLLFFRNSQFTNRNPGNNPGALFLIDGVVANRFMVAPLMMRDIEQVDILNSVASQTAVGIQTKGAGVINILTRRASPMNSFSKENVALARGYQESVRFPINQEGSLEKDIFKANWNATVFWNPYLETDFEGIGNFEFVLNDLQSELKIIVEGMSKTGQPIFGSYTIQVKE
ncbi:TonB-dependent receptor [Mongoliitalea daihaiensis]|uniref:TonB-dependent receptor n=1 Tax=Mongoliitalea daihaiensis TaxID=2782006 RepID=UPI001F1A4673|nr:TonB-dependent receptor [Mongoliitalea daihaiensis]UJP66023.1 TonB-dependent receptor [Mongoliitalea daihaiensis]